MFKRILLSLAVMVGIVMAGQALYADAPKLMLHDGADWKVQLKGFIKFDAVYNTRNTFHDPSPLWVNRQSYNDGATASTAGSFTIGVRSTRLALAISGPRILGAKSLGYIEGDFWGDTIGSGTPTRAGMFRMRHAFVKLNWDFGLYMLVGQFWTMMMPTKVLPNIVAFIPMASSGLLFMREQQITIGQRIGTDAFNIMLEGGIARPQGGDDNTDIKYTGARSTIIDNAGTGEVTGMPGLRGRVSLTIAPADMFNIHLGGAYSAQKERHTQTDDPLLPTYYQNRNLNSYAILGYGKITIFLLTLKGHWFTGSNLDTFFAGILQGTVLDQSDTSTDTAGAGTGIHSIRTSGGWGEVSFDLRKLDLPFLVSAGFGEENIKNRYYLRSGVRLSNRTMYVNTWIYLHSQFRVGLEVARHETKYKGDLGISEDMRYHIGTQFMF